MKTKPLNTGSAKALTDSISRRLESIASRSHKYDHQVFEDWVIMMSCALSMGTREEEYLQIVAKYSKECVDELGALFGEFVQAATFYEFKDVLGPIHMGLGSQSSKAAGGEFYTPNEVCGLMARLTLGSSPEVPHDRPFSISEPACGAGAMILACADVFVQAGHTPLNMLVHATDVSYLAVNMCYVQTTLWGIPCIVTWGNSLSLETWRTYRNPFVAMATGKVNFSALTAAVLKLEQIGAWQSGSSSTKPVFDVVIDKNGQSGFILDVA